MKNLLTVQTNFFRSLMSSDSILPISSATSAGGALSPKGSPLHRSLRGGKGGAAEEDDDRLWWEEEEGQSEIEKYADALPDTPAGGGARGGWAHARARAPARTSEELQRPPPLNPPNPAPCTLQPQTPAHR